MNGVDDSICVKIPEKIFFSNDSARYLVKNNFDITIYKYKADASSRQPIPCQRTGGEAYPTIYILGLEQLFAPGPSQQEQMDSFLKMFHTNGNREWGISYGRFRDTETYCAVITASALSLASDFSVGFSLSDKCVFTNIPETTSPITLQIYIDDFDFFFGDIPNRIGYQLSLNRGFAVYIEKLGAYLPSDPRTPVQAVYKDSKVDISWKIEQNERASAFLYDENGVIVANLPPYTATVHQDRKFTLTAYNDDCSVTQSVVVHRTLWKKLEEGTGSIPSQDSRGRFKIYCSYDHVYYLYVHPSLYRSVNLIDWEVYQTICDPPADVIYYASSFSYDRFGVCYLSKAEAYYYELSFNSDQWEKYSFEVNGMLAMQILLDRQPKMLFAAKGGVVLYDFISGRLMNPMFLKIPVGATVKTIDSMLDDGKAYLAVLCNNGRVYFYDLHDDFKNNIFECPNANGNWLYLVKSNAVYLVLDGYVFEVSDREKFSDLHFMPLNDTACCPIIGGVDTERIIGIFLQGKQLWEYKF